MTGTDLGLQPETIESIRKRIAATRNRRTDLRNLVADGKWEQAERDPTRALAYTQRVDRKAGHAEAQVGTNDFQQASFLIEGARALKSVARIAVETQLESRIGTGFLISPRLFLTNQHVIKDAADAAVTQVHFDDELDEFGKPRPTTTFWLDPNIFFEASDEGKLDYALVGVGERVRGRGNLTDYGYAALSKTPDRHRLGTFANIVQHPDGQRKSVVLRNNLIVERDEDDGLLLYETDTLKGSSGSPVFNDLWDVIALHHYGEVENAAAGDDASKPRLVNEGIRISAIYDDLSGRMDRLDEDKRLLLGDALVLWKDDSPSENELSSTPRIADGGLERPRRESGPGAVHAFSFAAPGDAVIATEEGSAQSSVPIEITVKIGSVDRLSAVENARSAEPSLTSVPKAEAKVAKLDRDYSSRKGFQADFVAGMDIDLGVIVEPVKRAVAKLKVQPRGRLKGELLYENFSVIMHDTRGIAILTATNIDGPGYIAIDRATGLPLENQPVREGDTWYKDTRIETEYTLTNDFYGEWSHYFDRGHLTRRNDPTWGDEARRANYDTFHFTNCSPQHWKFNQSIQFWQGIERYVLEQGLWKTGLKKRLSVLQGPLFDAPNPSYAGEVLIPSAFWKIIVWSGKGGLKAVGMVADQTRLLPIKRPKGTHRKDPDAEVDVLEFRSTIRDISERSGLDFSALEAIDTAGKDLPKVGENRQLLTGFGQFGI